MEAYLRALETPALPDDAVLHAVRLDDADADEDDVARVLGFAAELRTLAKPKYVLGKAAVTARGDGWVELDGHRFASALVAKNLEGVDVVRPFLATCGEEAERWSLAFDDVFDQYWADALKLLLLGEASAALDAAARECFPDGHMARMNPGSLPAWPLAAQRDLFAVLGWLADEAGVRLTDSCLMLPSKSVSGLFFASPDGFINCAFCTILTCPTRRAPFAGEFTY